ncbi:hypothetical protein EDD86DRAFT_228437 [Gorgonomyces haynaldii]|nr:hypothetical protein EDD86DRAFT_228437 [Gorgonomyces haynaldii]
MFLISSVLAQSQFCNDGNTFCVSGHKTGDNIVIHLFTNNNGWSAFGTGTGMRNSQMYTIWKNSTGGCTLAQAYSTAKSYPIPDSGDPVTQIAPYLPAPSWATLSCAFVRPAQQSKSTISSSSTFIWALSSSPPVTPDVSTSRFSIHQQDGRGQADFTVNGPAIPSTATNTTTSAVPSATAAPSILEPPSNWSDGYNVYLHGILMFLAWGLFPFFGIYAARFSKKSPVWFKIHIASFTLTFLATVAGFLLVFLFNTPPHFKSWHEIIGLIVCIGMVFQIVLGIYIDRTFDAERGTIPIRDKIHWVLGRLLFFLGLITIVTGMQQYHEGGQRVNSVLWWLFVIWVVVGDIALFFGAPLLEKTNDAHHAAQVAVQKEETVAEPEVQPVVHESIAEEKTALEKTDVKAAEIENKAE